MNVDTNRLRLKAEALEAGLSAKILLSHKMPDSPVLDDVSEMARDLEETYQQLLKNDIPHENVFTRDELDALKNW